MSILVGFPIRRDPKVNLLLNISLNRGKCPIWEMLTALGKKKPYTR
jgi:hypothetical protein